MLGAAMPARAPAKQGAEPHWAPPLVGAQVCVCARRPSEDCGESRGLAAGAAVRVFESVPPDRSNSRLWAGELRGCGNACLSAVGINREGGTRRPGMSAGADPEGGGSRNPAVGCAALCGSRLPSATTCA